MTNKKPNSGDNKIFEGGPSDYVRLEADFFFDSYPQNETTLLQSSSTRRTILVISAVKKLLNNVADDLQKGLGNGASVLRASDRETVITYLKKGNVELVLYSPGDDYLTGSSIMEALHTNGNFTLKSTLILLRKSDSELRDWIQHPAHSKYIMRAVNRLNEQPTG